MAAALNLMRDGGGSGRERSNGSSGDGGGGGGGGGSSSTSSCTRPTVVVAAAAAVTTLEASSQEQLDYVVDCSGGACGSLLFGQSTGGRSRGPAPRGGLVHGPRRHRNHSTRNNVSDTSGETTQAQAQRLLLVGPQQKHQYPFATTTTTTTASSQHLVMPQNEQLSSSSSSSSSSSVAAAAPYQQQFMDGENPASSLVNPGLQIDVSDTGSLQESDADEEEEPDESGNIHRVPNFATHRGAMEPGRADHVNEASSTLADIFRCFICLGKVVDAQLCPCCSKLVCQPCIKRWLTDQKSECPHCRAPLLVSQLVSCRFISEISLEVEKIQGKLGDNPLEKYCTTHDSPLLYFCTTCSVAVCSDCAILIEDHRNHTFEKLSVAYGRHRKKIRGEAAGLQQRHKELSVLIASVDKNIENVLKGITVPTTTFHACGPNLLQEDSNLVPCGIHCYIYDVVASFLRPDLLWQSKDDSAAELQMAFKRMQARLEEQLKCKLLALLAQKGSMTQEMELLDTILHELDQQINSIPKSDLIAQEPHMSRMLQGIRMRTFSDISPMPISPEFISEVVPAYEYGELVIKNYKTHLSQIRPTTFHLGGSNNSPQDLVFSKDVVFSEPVCASGVAWRLKVYPNGSGASQGTHLSVFLEMVEGGTEPGTYEYGIELIHHSRPNQCVIRKFSSDFEVGACWGYYQFFRIDLLEKEGYLLPEEDAITLSFYVRPLTYQQQCQDLQRALANLQVERDESATQVAVIRRAFAATFFQRRQRRSSSWTVHVDGQPSFTQAVAGAVTNLVSPTLVTRKAHVPSIKNIHLKRQEYSSSKAGKWLPGLWPPPPPPPPPPSEANILRSHLVNAEVSGSSAQMEHSPHDVMSSTHPLELHIPRHFGEESFTEFLKRSADIEAANVCCPQEEEVEEEEEDGNSIPVEHKLGTTLDVRAKEMQEIWHKNHEDIFQAQTAKARSHKKPRNRKAHKLLLASEGLLPHTLNLTSQMTILSMDSGHSAMNTTPSLNISNMTGQPHQEISPIPIVLTNEKRKETSREVHSADDCSDVECQSSRPAACVLDSGETANIK